MKTSLALFHKVKRSILMLGNHSTFLLTTQNQTKEQQLKQKVTIQMSLQSMLSLEKSKQRQGELRQLISLLQTQTLDHLFLR